MTFIWRIFISLSISSLSMMANDVMSCRELKPGVTQCNPYDTKFVIIKKTKSKIFPIGNRPITQKYIPVTKHIELKSKIAFSGLIEKYIKREERLYAYSKSKQLEREKETEKLAIETSSPVPDIKESKEVSLPIENIIPDVIKEKNITVVSQEEPKEIEFNLTVEVDVNKTKESLVLENVTQRETPVGSITYVPVEESNKTVEKKRSKKELPKKIVQKKETSTYIVRKGDSISSIAKKFGLEVKEFSSINSFNKKKIIRIGQKLTIPMTQEMMDAIDYAVYIVHRGDSLRTVSDKFGIDVKLLKKYNKITSKSVIKVGQALVLPLPHKIVEVKRQKEREKKKKLRKKRERERLARLALKKAKKAKFLRASKKLKRKIHVHATAYTSHRNQTDNTPFRAAWNNRIRPGMKIIAVSRDLIWKYGITNGSKVRISGLRGIYTVRDKMNKRWRKRIDIYMGTSRWRALRWGRRRVTLYY